MRLGLLFSSVIGILFVLIGGISVLCESSEDNLLLKFLIFFIELITRSPLFAEGS